MKLQHQFPNYDSALNDIIGNKYPVLSSNDSKKLSYFLCLANFKKGFDYYELDRHRNGAISFSLITVLGFKTIVSTSVPIENKDMEYDEWNKLIMKTAMAHFQKEKYRALKEGYVKKGPNAGCMAMLAIIIIPTVLYFTL